MTDKILYYYAGNQSRVREAFGIYTFTELEHYLKMSEKNALLVSKVINPIIRAYGSGDDVVQKLASEPDRVLKGEIRNFGPNCMELLDIALVAMYSQIKI